MTLTFALVLFSVALSAAAQILLKTGMSSGQVQMALSKPFGLFTVLAIGMSPTILLGLLTFGFSALVWLVVLSRIDVSLAYPCMALGIVATVLSGHFILGEPLTITRITGVAIIFAGVGVVAFGR